MAHPPTVDPALDRLRTALAKTYGERLERLVLFISRARGDHRPDSDYNVAVFIRNPASRWDELGRLSEITTDILVESGAVISAKPFDAADYHAPRPLMEAIRRDGREL